MAQTFVISNFHLVFSTKHRQALLRPEIESALYGYMNGIVTGLDSRCLAINGTEDHTHLLVSLSKKLPLSELLCQVKASSTKWIKAQNDGACSRFAWQDGYGAFSVSLSGVPAVIDYIARQKEHHSRMSFEEEYRTLLRRSGIEFDERYLFD